MSLTFAVPDLHGRRDLLDQSLNEIGGYAAGGTVVFLGDYIDRGPDSRGVVERLIGGPETGWRWIFLTGNHELIMRGSRDKHRPDIWMKEGGRATLRSYGHPETDAVDFSFIPEAHWRWFATLRAFHRDAHRFFVHAGVDPSLPLEQQTVRTLLNKRHTDGDRHGFDGRHLVHGHHAGATIRNGDRTALDLFGRDPSRLAVGVFDDQRAGGPVQVFEVTSAPAVQGLRLAG